MKNELQRIIDELMRIATDVSEVTTGTDADFQAERLRKQARKLEKMSTNIHGGGTGEQ